jgi:competence protein ComEC
VTRYPAYSYGDEPLINGKLETPQAIEDFDYQGYLANHGIYSTMLFPKIEVVDTSNGFRPLAWVYSLRSRLSQAMAETLPEPQASLAQGMILGIRGNIPQSLQDNFILSGTTHILGISGSQFNIVAGPFPYRRFAGQAKERRYSPCLRRRCDGGDYSANSP